VPAPALTSCSRCNRPLTAGSESGLCETCLATAPTLDVVEKAVPKSSNTLTNAAPPAAVYFAGARGAQYASTFTDANRTRTPQPGSDTAEPPDRRVLPESPPGYDLIQSLGFGGMGNVYLAREHISERIVAIKFLNAPSSAIAFDRFLVEVRAQANLRHAHIIEVLSVDAAGREPFFTMEHAPEGSLADLAKANDLPPPIEAARLVMQAAEGISFAHANKVLHRDLKPSNVLLVKSATGELTAKVSDFGLAKRTDRDEGLTHTGALGTAPYMSPEAAAGRYRDVDRASDVYGLGATLYHLLTGRPPFAGGDQFETIKKVLTDPVVRPRSLRADVPAGLEAIVMKCLEKDPARRYSGAADLAADLKLFVDGRNPDAPVLSRRRRTQKWLGRHRVRIAAVAAMLLIATALVAAGIMFRPDPELPPTPDAEAEYLASVRSKLQAGETVEMIGEKGLPKYHRFWLEKSILQEEPNGTCSFRGFGTSLLELVPPDLGIDHYEVSLELQHLRASIPGPQGAVDVDSIAFYFGHSSATVPHAQKTVHAMFTLLYKDFEMPAVANVPRTRGASLMLSGFIEDRNPETRTPLEPMTPSRITGILFIPTRNRLGAIGPEPSEWRRIVVEVGPQGVHVQWRADKANPNDKEKMVTVARWNGDETISLYLRELQALDARVPGALAVMPSWNPRLAFGVRASKSAVAIRNVWITPLPRPL